MPIEAGTFGCDAAMSAGGGPTLRLSEWIAATAPGRLPPATLAHARRALMNAIGCALGASAHHAVDASVATLRAVPAPDGVMLIGRRERVDRFDAAFVDTLASSLHTYDDTHLRTVIHPTGPVAFALLALEASAPSPSRERDFLAALAIGVEVSCRVAALLTDPPARCHVGHFLTGIACGIGAAAAGARALRLDTRRTASALGLAMQQASGTRAAHGTTGGAVAPAVASRAGAFSAALAANGFDGGGEGLAGPHGLSQVYAGVDAEPILAGLGERFEMLDVAFKPYPCGVVIHPVIDACLDLAARIDGQRAARVSLRVHPLVERLTGCRHPADGFAAKASVHHWAAVSLLRRSAGLAESTDACVADPVVRALRERVAITIDPSMPPAAAEVEVECDGRIERRRVEHASGSAGAPMSDDGLVAKLVAQAAPVIGERAAVAVAERCLALGEAPGATMKDFRAALVAVVDVPTLGRGGQRDVQ